MLLLKKPFLIRKLHSKPLHVKSQTVCSEAIALGIGQPLSIEFIHSCKG